MYLYLLHVTLSQQKIILPGSTESGMTFFFSVDSFAESRGKDTVFRDLIFPGFYGI
jgi:hypothetical protein